MKKILYSNFEDTSSIIDKMIKSPDLKKAIMRNNLYKFWEKVVGKKLAEKSRPYGMAGGGTLIIACQNPVISQELLLQKFQIMEKFKPYLKSLKINVKDIRFDCKKWESAD